MRYKMTTIFKFKSYIFIILFFWSCFGATTKYAYAQTGVVEYEYRTLRVQNRGVLYFNTSNSVFVLETNERTGVSSTEQGLSVGVVKSDSQGHRWYRDFAKKELWERHPATVVTPSVLIKDNWLPVQWKIYNQHKKIGGINCRKAVGEFRGRTYVVWFAETIPVPYGPWKLFGLPGLILEAKDTEGIFHYKATSVRYPCNDCPFSFEKPVAEKEMSIRQYVEEISDNFSALIAQHLRARMTKEQRESIRFELPQDKEAIRANKPERIYEWEE